METLRGLLLDHELKTAQNILNFQEGLFSELMESEVTLNEAAEETQLNSIMNDVFRRMEEAKEALKDANRTKDREAKRSLLSGAMTQLNRTNKLMDMVLKKWFPDDGKGEGTPQGERLPDSLSFRQAAESLGVHASRIQNLIASGQLRAVNDNGKWAVRGDDVQKLLDQGYNGR
jgi:excisionase family DNA binding protein